LIAEPRKDDDICARRRPKARRANIYCGAEAGLVNVDRFDLKPDDAPAVEMHDG
jgi:hypothetical protein